MIDEDFASVEQTMSEGIQEAKQGLEIIQQVQTALPDIRKLGDQANDLGNVTLDGANQLEKALPGITQSVGTILKAIGTISAGVNTALEDLKIIVYQLKKEKQLSNNCLKA